MAKTTIPLLFPAPPWAPSRSAYQVLWHGCTDSDKDGIEQTGRIDLGRCAVNTDFGRGFYLTTLERQARQWAWERFYDSQAKGEKPKHPVILRFEVPRYAIPGDRFERGMADLRSLAFVRGDYDNEDYWSLVQHCRQSVHPHANTHERPRSGWYDMVSGPVAAFWRQRVAMLDADQFSFHEGGVDLLDDIIRRGNPFYRWSPVV